jgi:ankyrin repeat protein
LYYAACFGLLDMVKYLIDHGADLDAPGSRYGGTALHGAVLRHHIPVVEALLEAGALARQADFHLITPLHTAAAHGQVEIVKLLLQYGALRDAEIPGEGTPVDWAIKASQKEVLDLLLDNATPGAENRMKSFQEVCMRNEV